MHASLSNGDVFHLSNASRDDLASAEHDINDFDIVIVSDPAQANELLWAVVNLPPFCVSFLHNPLWIELIAQIGAANDVLRFHVVNAQIEVQIMREAANKHVSDQRVAHDARSTRNDILAGFELRISGSEVLPRSELICDMHEGLELFVARGGGGLGGRRLGQFHFSMQGIDRSRIRVDFRRIRNGNTRLADDSRKNTAAVLAGTHDGNGRQIHTLPGFAHLGRVGGDDILYHELAELNFRSHGFLLMGHTKKTSMAYN